MGVGAVLGVEGCEWICGVLQNCRGQHRRILQSRVDALPCGWLHSMRCITNDCNPACRIQARALNHQAVKRTTLIEASVGVIVEQVLSNSCMLHNVVFELL